MGSLIIPKRNSWRKWLKSIPKLIQAIFQLKKISPSSNKKINHRNIPFINLRNGVSLGKFVVSENKVEFISHSNKFEVVQGIQSNIHQEFCAIDNYGKINNIPSIFKLGDIKTKYVVIPKLEANWSFLNLLNFSFTRYKPHKQPKKQYIKRITKY